MTGNMRAGTVVSSTLSREDCHYVTVIRLDITAKEITVVFPVQLPKGQRVKVRV